MVARGGHPGLGNHIFAGSRQHKGMVSCYHYIYIYYLESRFSMAWYKIDTFVSVDVGAKKASWT